MDLASLTPLHPPPLLPLPHSLHAAANLALPTPTAPTPVLCRPFHSCDHMVTMGLLLSPTEKVNWRRIGAMLFYLPPSPTPNSTVPGEEALK